MLSVSGFYLLTDLTNRQIIIHNVEWETHRIWLYIHAE